MNKTIFCLLILFTSCFHGGSQAETIYYEDSSDLSLTVAPDILGPNGDNIRIDIAYGRYIRDNTALRLRLFHNVIEDIAPNDNDYKSQAVSFYYERHFSLGDKWSPYLGASIGYRKTLFNNAKASSTTYGPLIGIKYHLSERAALDFSVDYFLSDKKIFLVDFEPEDTVVSLGIGFRLFFQ